MKKASLLFVVGMVSGLVALVAPTASAAATLWVNDDAVAGGNASCADPGYSSIQAAVNASSAGDTISVCPGTYPENVSIQHQLLVDGVGPATGQVVDPASGSAIRVFPNADGTTLSDITATGATGFGNNGSGVQLIPTPLLTNVSLIRLRSVSNQTHGVSINSDGAANTVSNLLLDDVELSDNGTSGFAGRMRGSVDGLTITNSSLERNDNGIDMGLVDGLADMHINGNNISGNSEFGLNNENAVVIDAECNWWGSASGPTTASNPGGTGDDVSANVDYQPWLVAPAPGGACSGGANPPPSKAACKNRGWMDYTDDAGRRFRDQGDCVSYVKTDGRNKADG